MKKPFICIAYKIVHDTSGYARKVLFKKELFKLKAAKSLDKMCSFREFLDKHQI